MSTSASPEAMRTAMAEYVRAVHQAYLDASAPLSPGDRARLPLLSAGEVTVLAVGARNLHVLATTEQLPAPRGQEVELDDAIDDLRWRLRFFDPVVVPAWELPIKRAPNARVCFLPIVAGFVGADTIAGIIATRIYESDGFRLLVDIGTNGEVVLGSKERLLVCSAPAGPTARFASHGSAPPSRPA